MSPSQWCSVGIKSAQQGQKQCGECQQGTQQCDTRSYCYFCDCSIPLPGSSGGKFAGKKTDLLGDPLEITHYYLNNIAIK